MKKIEIKTQIKENCYKIVNKKLKQNLQEDIVLEESWDETLKQVGDVSQYVAAGALFIPRVGPMISRIASGTALAAHTTRALIPSSHWMGVESRGQALMDAATAALPFGGGGTARMASRIARKIPSTVRTIPGSRLNRGIGRGMSSTLRRSIRGATDWFAGKKVLRTNGRPRRVGYTRGARPYDIASTTIAPLAIEHGNPAGPRSERQTAYAGGQTREEIRSKETGIPLPDWRSMTMGTLGYAVPSASMAILRGLVFKK